MESPLQVTFKGMDTSDALLALIEMRAARLERFFDRITHCHVVVEQPDRHHARGGHFEVHVRLGVPGRELAVARDPGRHERHVDAHAAVRDAFDAAEGQLKSWLGQVRERPKRREDPRSIVR